MMHRLFFSLLIILLPVQLGLHFWPDWAMVLGRRVDYLSPTLYLTDILIVLTLVSWRNLPKIIYWPFIVAFIGVNIFFAARWQIAAYYWIKLIEFGLLGFYIVKTKVQLSSLSYPLSIGVLYSSLIAIGQFMFQHSIGGPLWFLGERTFTIDTPGIARTVIGGKELLRAYGTFPHPNVLGGFLATTLPLMMNHQINKSSNQQIIKWVTIGLGIIALTLTFSRSAWAVFILMLSAKKKVFLVLLLLLFFIPLSSTDESFIVRSQLNSAALKIWGSAWLFGVGLGNFLVSLPNNLVSRTIYFLQPVHNIYLLLLSEIGVIGVIGAIGVMRKRIRFTLPLVALLLLGLVDHYPSSLQQGQLLLTIFMALSYRGRR